MSNVIQFVILVYGRFRYPGLRTSKTRKRNLGFIANYDVWSNKILKSPGACPLTSLIHQLHRPYPGNCWFGRSMTCSRSQSKRVFQFVQHTGPGQHHRGGAAELVVQINWYQSSYHFPVTDDMISDLTCSQYPMLYMTTIFLIQNYFNYRDDRVTIQADCPTNRVVKLSCFRVYTDCSRKKKKTFWNAVLLFGWILLFSNSTLAWRYLACK